MADPTASGPPEAITYETVPLSTLRPHPDNYRAHPQDQIDHLIASLTTHGVYRPLVVSSDDVILAGHGLAVALEQMGTEQVRVARVPHTHDHPNALKLMVGDNEISGRAFDDDRKLTEVLKAIYDSDQSEEGLQGTGFDPLMLAGLVMVTRPAQEVPDFDAAAHWVGMPEYDEGQPALKLVLSFRSEEDRAHLLEMIGIEKTYKPTASPTLSAWWPPRPEDDWAAVEFVPEELEPDLSHEATNGHQ